MAATLTSTQYDAQVAAKTNFADRMDDSRQIGGTVQYAKLVVNLTADNAANDVIEMVELPLGAIVLPELSFLIVSDDFSAGATVDVGDTDDADRYSDGADVGALGTVQFLAPAYPAGFLTEHRVDEDTRTILCTIKTLTTPAVGVLVMILAYKCL